MICTNCHSESTAGCVVCRPRGFFGLQETYPTFETNPQLDRIEAKIDTLLAKKKTKPRASKKHEYSTVWLDKVWRAYPKRSGSNPKHRAYCAWEARVSDGEGYAEMFAGLQRYIHFCAATDILGTCYVMQAATFFGPDKHYENDWTIPKKKHSEDPDKQHHATYDPKAKVIIAAGENPYEGM